MIHWAGSEESCCCEWVEWMDGGVQHQFRARTNQHLQTTEEEKTVQVKISRSSSNRPPSASNRKAVLVTFHILELALKFIAFVQPSSLL